jgi:hypothetical protein
VIIGLSGYARAGKDTVADRLVVSHGFTKLGFADALKEAAYVLNPILSVNQITDIPIYLAEHIDAVGWERAKETAEVRRLLQRLGTEVGRNLWGEDFWVERLAARALRYGGNIVVPDCRFPNEAQFVQVRGQVWRIHRPGTEPVNPHPSETALDDWDFDRHLVNDSTVAALHERVDYLVEALL